MEETRQKEYMLDGSIYIKRYKYTLIHSDRKQISGHWRNEGGEMGRVPSPAGDRFTVSIGMVCFPAVHMHKIPNCILKHVVYYTPILLQF